MADNSIHDAIIYTRKQALEAVKQGLVTAHRVLGNKFLSGLVEEGLIDAWNCGHFTPTIFLTGKGSRELYSLEIAATPSLAPDNKAIQHFCCSLLGLPNSKRIEQYGIYAPNFAPWELDIMLDCQRYDAVSLAKCVEHGRHGFGQNEVREFSNTFCRMINTILPEIDLLSFEHHVYAQAICLTFIYGDREGVIDTAKAIAAYKKEGERPLRFYDNNLLYLVSSSALKNWLPTTAIWTVDAVLADIISQD